jgi:hypothetical protein
MVFINAFARQLFTGASCKPLFVNGAGEGNRTLVNIPLRLAISCLRALCQQQFQRVSGTVVFEVVPRP